MGKTILNYMKLTTNQKNQNVSGKKLANIFEFGRANLVEVSGKAEQAPEEKNINTLHLKFASPI